MLSKQNQAEMLIFSPQICIRVDSDENLNIFHRLNLNPLKFTIFNFFFKSCLALNEFIFKNFVNILILTPEMCQLPY
jgi:hypothetical protein